MSDYQIPAEVLVDAVLSVASPNTFYKIRDHLNEHMTDGRWHDECHWCRLRRMDGGTGVELLDKMQEIAAAAHRAGREQGAMIENQMRHQLAVALTERDQLRADLARARQRIDAALAVHRRYQFVVAHGDEYRCEPCDETWPCATVRALTGDGQDGGTSDDGLIPPIEKQVPSHWLPDYRSEETPNG